MTAPPPEAPEQGEKSAAVGGWTPGPWSYGKSDNYCGYWIAPRMTLPTLAAVERCCDGPRMTVTTFNFPGNTEANARLIAAAPQMAEALQAAMRARVVRDGDVVDQMRAALSSAGASW